MKKRKKRAPKATHQRTSSWVMRNIEHNQMVHPYWVNKRGWRIDKYSGGRICNDKWESIGVDCEVWSVNVDVGMVNKLLDKVES